MKTLYYFLLPLFAATVMTSCTDVDDRVIPFVGEYSGQIVGLTPPFIMNISGDHSDHLTLDAPVDGIDWYLVDMDLDNLDNETIDIDILRQKIAPGIEIKGDGWIRGRNIQIDYSMWFDGEKEKFRLVGTKF
jgi:hypothetical protein